MFTIKSLLPFRGTSFQYLWVLLHEFCLKNVAIAGKITRKPHCCTNFFTVTTALSYWQKQKKILIKTKKEDLLSSFPVVILLFFRADVFFNFCGLTNSVTEIIKLGPSDLTSSDNFNAVNLRRMNREYSFNTNSER